MLDKQDRLVRVERAGEIEMLVYGVQLAVNAPQKLEEWKRDLHEQVGMIERPDPAADAARVERMTDAIMRGKRIPLGPNGEPLEPPPV